MRIRLTAGFFVVAFSMSVTRATAQVDGRLWGDPDPFPNSSIVQVHVDGWWDLQPPSCPYICRPEYVWVYVQGSDGFTASSEGYVPEFTTFFSWVFGDALPGQLMVPTSYYGEVVVQWRDLEMGWEYWGWRGFVGSVSPQPPTVSGPGTVWWFDGEHPSGYETSITLQTDGGSEAVWEIVAGAASLSTTTGQSTVLTATGPSGSLNDIHVRVSRNGVLSNDFSVTARAPNSLSQVGYMSNCSSLWGYDTYVVYRILDNLGDRIPSGTPLNEQWATGVFNDWPGTNWSRGDPESFTSSGSDFADHIQGACKFCSRGPMPVPGCSGDTTPVQHWLQEWRVGSLSIGAGSLVQTNALRKLRDSALHEIW